MILREMEGIKVVERLFSETENRLACVLSDPNPQEIMIARTKKLKIPLLSPEWVIQSLYVGEAVEFNGSPKYAFDGSLNETAKHEIVEKSPRKKKSKKSK